jgi:hypothetical protein
VVEVIRAIPMYTDGIIEGRDSTRVAVATRPTVWRLWWGDLDLDPAAAD